MVHPSDAPFGSPPCGRALSYASGTLVDIRSRPFGSYFAFETRSSDHPLNYLRLSLCRLHPCFSTDCHLHLSPCAPSFSPRGSSQCSDGPSKRRPGMHAHHLLARVVGCKQTTPRNTSAPGRPSERKRAFACCLCLSLSIRCFLSSGVDPKDFPSRLLGPLSLKIHASVPLKQVCFEIPVRCIVGGGGPLAVEPTDAPPPPPPPPAVAAYAVSAAVSRSAGLVRLASTIWLSTVLAILLAL